MEIDLHALNYSFTEINIISAHCKGVGLDDFECPF